MTWNSNGFLGVYAEWMEKGQPGPVVSKAEELKQFRVSRFEERERRDKAKRGREGD